MQNSSYSETRRGLLMTLVLLGLVTALIMVPSQFRSEAGSKTGEGLFTRTSSADPALPNYDIRWQKSDENETYLTSARQAVGKDASAVADIKDSFVRGENSLRTRVATVKFEYNEELRRPEVITPDVWKDNVEYLTGPSTAVKHAEILRNFIRENNDLIGVNDAQANSLRVTADYTNPDGYLSFAHLEQFINDVPVFAGEIKAGFNKEGRMMRVINNLAPGLDYASLKSDFHNPVDAMKVAFRNLNIEPSEADLAVNQGASTNLKSVFGSGDWANQAEKMYFPTEVGVAVPAWRVLIWRPVNAYYVIVDAENGTVLWRKNLTNDQAQTSTYQIYRNANAFIGSADSPAPLSPGPLNPTTNTQGTIITRSNVTLIGNEGADSFNNLGWITDGTNITDGNNVQAGIDRDGTNGVDAPATGNPNRVFDSTWNPPPGNPAPGDDPLTTQAQRGAVIQMFYVMNRYHDELYKLGFTEAARNYQNDNFGRGGVAGDRISAEGQDSSGTNNANFSIVADGTRGRMQMFLWTGPTPDYDGTTDAEVIIHEVTHGTSQRLHGNAAGLSSNMSGGMGEGWGDFYGYSMLAEPSDPINAVYTTGGYATFSLGGMMSNYYYGIRRFPRAPITFTGGPNNKPHNPFTFKHLNGNCDTTLGTTSTAIDSAFPRNPVVSTSSGVQACDQVHNAGEVWSSALWEVRNRMVSRLGFTPGTTRVLQVVTDGMKLAPLNPTFLQERDAIIAAASALPVAPEASADVLDVREGFRVRGMGFSASIQNPGTGGNTAAVTEAFDVPNALITNPISVSDSPGDNDGFPEPGESILVSVPVTNNSGGGTINNVMVSVTGGGTVNYGNIADGNTVTNQIPYTVPAGATCGTDHTITITGTSALGALNPKTFTFRLGAPVGGAPVTFTNSTALTINDGATGAPAATTPYGTTINVSGLTGNKVMKMTFNGLSHTFPGDIDVLLVGPAGQKMIVMSDVVGTNDAVNTTFSLIDTATDLLPANAALVNGASYRPSDVTSGDTFPAPAPGSPYQSATPVGTSTFASVFGTTGSGLNGTWTMYMVDDAGIDTGNLAGGWSLTFEANDYACVLANVKSRADFDGDGKTDLSVFRPSSGQWFLNRSTAGFAVVGWGVSTDVLTPGDYDGDGKADTAVFRANTDATQPDFFILNSNGFTVTGVSWGTTGDVPVVADYDSDGKSDAAVFRPSTNTWYILKSGGGFTATAFGQAGDVPVAGNFAGTPDADLTVFRSSTNSWVTQPSGGGGVLNFVHGQPGDLLVPADYDGDNIDDRAVYRPSTGVWYILKSTDGMVRTVAFGNSTDIPVPGDYDGDGSDDVAIYRNGQWWLNRSTSGLSIQNFGLGTDKAIPKAYIP